MIIKKTCFNVTFIFLSFFLSFFASLIFLQFFVTFFLLIKTNILSLSLVYTRIYIVCLLQTTQRYFALVFILTLLSLSLTLPLSPLCNTHIYLYLLFFHLCKFQDFRSCNPFARFMQNLEFVCVHRKRFIASNSVDSD